MCTMTSSDVGKFSRCFLKFIENKRSTKKRDLCSELLKVTASFKREKTGTH